MAAFGVTLDPLPYVRRLSEYWRDPPLQPEAREFLQRCAADGQHGGAARCLPICIVSNADRADVDAALGRLELRVGAGFHVAALVTSEDARSYKPHREIFELALRQTGWRRDRVLHIGDIAAQRRRRRPRRGAAQRLGQPRPPHSRHRNLHAGPRMRRPAPRPADHRQRRGDLTRAGGGWSRRRRVARGDASCHPPQRRWPRCPRRAMSVWHSSDGEGTRSERRERPWHQLEPGWGAVRMTKSTAPAHGGRPRWAERSRRGDAK